MSSGLKILELTFDELRKVLHARYGKGIYHARAVYREVFQNGIQDLKNTADFSNSRNFARVITSDLEINAGELIETKKENGTTKFITRLQDGHEIESVVIPMATHNTICVSSQVGCRFGCTFCQTGQMGFARNLTTEEIIGQVYSAKFKLNLTARNVVFMGMGEPFDNFDNVIQAVRVLNDQRGFNVALRYITISTVGEISAIQKLASLGMKRLRLSISLNASNDYVRARIMPSQRISSMRNLQHALIDYSFSEKETFFITYILIQNINDTFEDAIELAEYVKPIPSKINIIPYNPRSASPFESPSEEKVLPACGQLGKIKES